MACSSVTSIVSRLSLLRLTTNTITIRPITFSFSQSSSLPFFLSPKYNKVQIQSNPSFYFESSPPIPISIIYFLCLMILSN